LNKFIIIWKTLGHWTCSGNHPVYLTHSTRSRFYLALILYSITLYYTLVVVKIASRKRPREYYNIIIIMYAHCNNCSRTIQTAATCIYIYIYSNVVMFRTKILSTEIMKKLLSSDAEWCYELLRLAVHENPTTVT